MNQRTLMSLVAAVSLVAVLAFGAAAQALEPSEQAADGSRVIGNTAFAYMSGLRRFAAAVLWNRLDPQFDLYYGGSLDNATFMLPTVRMVQSLDPQFPQSYYVGAWVIARNGDPDTGVELAREGVRVNPRIGLLYSNLIQLLTYQGTTATGGKRDPNLPEEVRLAERALRSDVEWNLSVDRYEGLGVFASVFDRANMPKRAAAMRAEQEKMRAQGQETTPTEPEAGQN